MKWAFIGPPESEFVISEVSAYLNKNDVANKLEIFNCSEEELKDTLVETTGTFDHVKIDSHYGIQVLELFEAQQTVINRTLGYCDCLTKKNGVWWTDCDLVKGVDRVILDSSYNVDRSMSVLLIGSDPIAKVMFAGLSQLGFKSFTISGDDEDACLQLINDIKSKYFSIDLEYTPRDQLVLLPGDYSVLANVSTLREDNETLKELYYFNFLDRDGLVIDMNMVPVETPLLLEAKEMGLHTLTGNRFFSASMYRWLTEQFAFSIDQDQFFNFVSELVTSVEFDLAPFGYKVSDEIE